MLGNPDPDAFSLTRVTPNHHQNCVARATDKWSAPSGTPVGGFSGRPGGERDGLGSFFPAWIRAGPPSFHRVKRHIDHNIDNNNNISSYYHTTIFSPRQKHTSTPRISKAAVYPKNRIKNKIKKMSVTTTDNARVTSLRHTLADYDLHHSQPTHDRASEAPSPNSRPAGDSSSSPAEWETQWRRVPAYRPVNPSLIESGGRNEFNNAIERNFIRVMFGGVWMQAVS